MKFCAASVQLYVCVNIFLYVKYKLDKMIHGYKYIFFQPVSQDGLAINAKINVDSVSNSILVTMLMEIVPEVVLKVSKENCAKHVCLSFFKLACTQRFCVFIYQTFGIYFFIISFYCYFISQLVVMANSEKIAHSIVQETALIWLFVINTRDRVKAAEADIEVPGVTKVSQALPISCRA